MTIDGVDIATYDLTLLKVPPVTKAEKRVRRITIPGRSGFLTEWSGDYESYVKEPEFLYTGSDINEGPGLSPVRLLVIFPNEPDYAYAVGADEKITVRVGWYIRSPAATSAEPAIETTTTEPDTYR